MSGGRRSFLRGGEPGRKGKEVYYPKKRSESSSYGPQEGPCQEEIFLQKTAEKPSVSERLLRTRRETKDLLMALGPQKALKGSGTGDRAEFSERVPLFFGDIQNGDYSPCTLSPTSGTTCRQVPKKLRGQEECSFIGQAGSDQRRLCFRLKRGRRRQGRTVAE